MVGGGPPGRREHLDEQAFIRELEKLYAQNRSEKNGNVTVTIGKLEERRVKAATTKSAGSKKAKQQQQAEKPQGGAAKYAVVRGKRKGKTVSTLVSANDVVKFQVCTKKMRKKTVTLFLIASCIFFQRHTQATLASVLRSNLDTLKRPAKTPKAKSAAKVHREKKNIGVSHTHAPTRTCLQASKE